MDSTEAIDERSPCIRASSPFKAAVENVHRLDHLHTFIIRAQDPEFDMIWRRTALSSLRDGLPVFPRDCGPVIRSEG